MAPTPETLSSSLNYLVSGSLTGHLVIIEVQQPRLFSEVDT